MQRNLETRREIEKREAKHRGPTKKKTKKRDSVNQADDGTNDGTAWTRPGSVPASSATLLVTNYAYNAMGLVQDVTDPMGIDTRTLYDNLGKEKGTAYIRDR